MDTSWCDVTIAVGFVIIIVIKKGAKMKNKSILAEKDLQIKLQIGDTILFGKFKNKKGIVKGFGKNDKGQPTVITDKKEFNLLNFRIEKLMD